MFELFQSACPSKIPAMNGFMGVKLNWTCSQHRTGATGQKHRSKMVKLHDPFQIGGGGAPSKRYTQNDFKRL